jgi:hypothetical protein
MLPRGHLTIKVVDTMGAFIPGAEIAIDPEDKVQTRFKTDTLGYGSLDLPFGTHVLSIAVLGFYKWTNKIEIRDGGDHVIEATLRVRENVDVWPVEGVILIEPESVILASSIPLNTLQTLAPLPIRKKSCCKTPNSRPRNLKAQLPRAS